MDDGFPRKVRVSLVIALLSIMAVLQLTSIREEVQTIDEGVHLTAGVSYWLTGDYRLNEEHPPLVKLLAAVPVLFSNPKIDFESPSWQNGDQWAFAREFLYQQGNNADTLLFLGRLPMIGLCLLFGLLLYFWGRKLAGDMGGLLTLGWFAFDPNFLAHGRYITTDIPVALGYAATLYVFVRLLERWTWQRAVVFSAVFGLTQVTKFSALFLYAIILITPVLWYYKSNTAKSIVQNVLRILGLAVVGTLVAIALTYGGQIKKGSADPWAQSLYQERLSVIQNNKVADQPKTIQRIIAYTNPDTCTGKIIERLTLQTPIFGWSYLKGVVLVLNHDFWGHLAYVKGMHSNFGWWWYFPFAILVKTPFATLLTFCLGLFALAIRWRKNRLIKNPAALVLFGGGMLYLLWSMTSHLNLGLRHVFPFYAGVFVMIGAFLASVLRFHNIWLRLTMLGVATLYLTSSLLTYPTYTSYFSELVGGVNNGPKYLVDSNIDWGQDAKRLVQFTQQHNIPYVCMSYFGQASLTYYGLDNRYVPTLYDPHDPEDIQCVVAISVTSLLSQDRLYSWLEAYAPDVRIGGSIYLYDFRNGRTPSPATVQFR